MPLFADCIRSEFSLLRIDGRKIINAGFTRSFGAHLHVAHLAHRSQAAQSPAIPARHRDTAGTTAVTNVYLLTDAARSLLVDTGPVAAQDLVLSWLADTLPDSSALCVAPLRMGEFDSIANMVAVAAKFPIETIFGAQVDGLGWFDVHPEPPSPGALQDAVYQRMPSQAGISLSDGRTVEAVQPLLRLLTTHWLYDPLTGSVFTSDAFSYAGDVGSGGDAWTVSAGSDAITVDDVCRHLVRTRYWWLPGADTRPISEWLEQFFACHDVERICPAHGAVLDGAGVVRRHVELLLAALHRFRTEPRGYPFARAATVAGGKVAR